MKSDEPVIEHLWDVLDKQALFWQHRSDQHKIKKVVIMLCLIGENMLILGLCQWHS